MEPTEEFLSLGSEKRRAVQIELCRRALDVLNEYFASAGEISYFESVVGTQQIVDPQLPNEAFAAVLDICAAPGIAKRYGEPIVALHDDDIPFPGKIEICYYAVYNLFRKYCGQFQIDDRLIVSQALAAFEMETEKTKALAQAIKKIMNNRIEKEFGRLAEEGRGGLIPFIVAGDPNLQITKELILEVSKQGANVIELGMPFSDPVADGVTIQASAERALRNSVPVRDILQIVAEVRESGCQTPIILFSYFNPILQFGLENFAEDAEKSGVDGILITDLVPEEAEEFRDILKEKDLALIMLAAPTSSDERLQKICEKASGFVYAVSRAGVTGARSETSSDAENLVARLKKCTNLPVAVGFGISNAAQVAETWKYAAAAVVGSAIVAEMMRLTPDADEVPEDFVERIGAFTARLLPDNS